MKAIRIFSALLLVFLAVPCIAMALEWHIETVDGGIGGHTSISLDSNGYPHISYFDETNYDLKYAYFDGSSWQIETVDSEGYVGIYTSLSLDSGDYPHISYRDETNYDLKYAYFDGSSWQIETVDSEGNVGMSTSLFLDSGDYPHISYYDYTNGYLKYAYAYSPVVPPIIESISPEIGQISGGDEVTITGNYFQDGATVTIGGNPATEVTVDSETPITAKIPPGELGITDVVVTNPGGQSSTLVRGFAYIPVYGDVSGNETVSAYDAALILRFVVGLMSEFPVQLLLSPNQNITPRNYTVSIPEQSAKAGSKIQVPIVIDDATRLFAGGISIEYDASVLKVVDALPTNMLNGSYWKTNVSLPSEVRFAFATTELMQGSGSLLTIEFQVLPGAEGKSSPLSFSSINLSNSLSIGKIDGLITVFPAKTALFSNYPNPFNPETWIPYQLSQDAPVAIYIYSSNGQLVRRLSLGHQSAGVYVSKAQAAQWDGKNSLGQNVASGIYYYTLQAGEFSATRKMVILK